MPSPNDLVAQDTHGTTQRTSPKVMLTGKQTRKSDIYSFGMTMYEVVIVGLAIQCKI